MPKATLTASNCIGLSKHTQLKSIQLYPMEMHRSCSAYRHDNCVDSPFARALPMEISTWLDWIVLLADSNTPLMNGHIATTMPWFARSYIRTSTEMFYENYDCNILFNLIKVNLYRFKWSCWLTVKYFEVYVKGIDPNTFNNLLRRTQMKFKEKIFLLGLMRFSLSHSCSMTLSIPKIKLDVMRI